jgi:copper chaperone NosL
MKSNYRITILLVVVGFLACTPKPQPIEYGSDECHFCKMTIMDNRHAAEAVTKKGKVFKFDAIECLVAYVREEPGEQFALQLVCDYENPGEWLDATQCRYLISQNIPSPMGAFLSAFRDDSAVDKMLSQKGGEKYDWPSLLQSLH